jgi:hypothetical protein
MPNKSGSDHQKYQKCRTHPKTSQDTKMIIFFMEKIIQKSLNISKKILEVHRTQKSWEIQDPKMGVL